MLLRLTDMRPDVEIEKAIDATVGDATAAWEPQDYEGEYPVSGFGIGTLRPKYVLTTAITSAFLSSAYWGASVAASQTFADWINVTMTDMCYVIPTGVFDLEAAPKITEVHNEANGQSLPTINIEEMFGWDLARAFYRKPYVVRPNNNITVAIQGRDVTTAGERFGLLGYAIAKRAYLILKN